MHPEPAEAYFSILGDQTAQPDTRWCEITLKYRTETARHSDGATLYVLIPFAPTDTIEQASRAAQAAAIRLLEAALSSVRSHDPATLDHQGRLRDAGTPPHSGPLPLG